MVERMYQRNLYPILGKYNYTEIDVNNVTNFVFIIQGPLIHPPFDLPLMIFSYFCNAVPEH